MPSFAGGGTTFPDYGTPGAVNKWIETILDAPELIEFDQDNGDGLRPVWSLIEDPARADLVREAFHVYAKAHGRGFDTFDPEIVPLYGFTDWKPTTCAVGPIRSTKTTIDRMNGPCATNTLASTEPSARG
jgi:hypothetical protein